MGLLSLTKALTSRVPYLHSAITIFENSGFKHSKPQVFNYDYATRQYAGWIAAALNVRAKSVAANPLRLYVHKGSRLFGTRKMQKDLYYTKSYLMGERGIRPSTAVLRKTAEWGDDFVEVVESHPILEILWKPSIGHTGYGLTFQRMLDLYLTGQWYLHPVINPITGIPQEVWWMPSMWTEPVPDRDGNWVSGYVFGQQAFDKKEFKLDEVIRGRYPHPRDLFYGMGLVEMAWSSVGLTKAKAEMDLAFVENYMRPDFAIIAKDATAPNLKRARADFERDHRGRHKKGKAWWFSGEVDIKELNKPPEQLGDQEAVVQKLLAVLGVPLDLLTGGDTGLANSRSIHHAFLRDTVAPDCRMDEEVLNQQYLPLFGEDVASECFLAYDSAIPADRAFQLKEDVSMVRGGILTPNEVRVQRGLPAHVDGDKLYQPSKGPNNTGANADGSDGSQSAESDLESTT